MVNDLAKRPVKEQRRSSEVEDMFALDAQAAKSFDGWRRLTTLWTKGRNKGLKTRPAFQTCPSPPALLNWSVTLDTRDWEQEIEYVVEQSAFGETQRANSV